MRLRTLILWLVFLVAFGWFTYTVALAGWSYFITQETVDKALREATGRHLAALASGSPRALERLAADVRYSILLGARREGLPILEENVHVSANSAGVTARVRWLYRVFGLDERDILVVPIAIQRSFTPPPP